MPTPVDLLKKYWGYDTFKGLQEQIISHVLGGNDTVALLPTGAGKSVCYQIPALKKAGICLVISPLIALMNDQVQHLKKKGVQAIALTSALNKEETIIAFDNLLYGKYKFLYISPEKLQSEFIRQKLQQLEFSLIAVDEAHCISEWGHDFRPAYLKIAEIKEFLGDVQVIALTATATPKVLQDIKEHLQIADARVFRQSLIRENIAIHCIYGEDDYFHLNGILIQHQCPTIIYVNSRKKARDISLYLNHNQFKSSYYHGAMLSRDKTVSFDEWMQGKSTIMVATNAFGMGIDKEDVGLIIHLDLPFSLENYMQEAGRAGRNGKRAYSYLFANKASIDYLKKRVSQSQIDVATAKLVYKQLVRYFHIAYGELSENLYDFNLSEFCSQYKISKVKVYNTLKLLEKEGVLYLDEDPNKSSTLQFKVTPKTVLEYAEKNKSKLIPTLLRTYGGVFEQPVTISETILAKRIGISTKGIIALLHQLKEDHMADYIHRANTIALKFLLPREDDLTINTFARTIKKQYEVKQEKLNAVLKFVSNTEVCRNRFLLPYFGEPDSEDCGICDICLTKNQKKPHNEDALVAEIQDILVREKQLSIKELVACFDEEPTYIINILQILLDSHKIRITSQNKLQLV